MHPIASAEDWWAIVRRSGYRGTIEQLGATELAKVQELNFAGVRKERCRQVETNALYPLATKPDA